MIPQTRRPPFQSLDKRADKIRKAIVLLAAAEPDWPTYDLNHASLDEALRLLYYVLANLENSL